MKRKFCLLLFLFTVIGKGYPFKVPNTQNSSLLNQSHVAFFSSLFNHTETLEKIATEIHSKISLMKNMNFKVWKNLQRRQQWLRLKTYENQGTILDPEREEAVLLERLLISGCKFLQKVMHSGGHLFIVVGDVIGRTNSWPLRKLGALLIQYSSKLNATASKLSNSLLAETSSPIHSIASKVASGFSHFLLFIAEWIQFASSRMSLSLANSIWQLEKIPKSLQITIFFLLQSRVTPPATFPSPVSELQDISSTMAGFYPNLTNLSLIMNQSRSYRSRTQSGNISSLPL
jgi:hypothetical protein